MVTKPVPVAEAIKLGDLDPETARMMFEQSPEAEQEFIESLLTIPNEQRRVVDMKLYPQQLRMLYDRTGRDITIKGRQTRASSLILARNLRPMVTQWGVKQLVMTQDDQTTTQFRLRIKHHLADLLRHGWAYELALDNDNEMVIAGLENQYVFASGQQKVAGRAYTAAIVHLSELSHWPNQDTARKLIGDITPAVPGFPNGQFDIESTPNGPDDVFYDYVMDAKPANPLSRWTGHFYFWWLEPRYKAGVSVGCDLLLTETEYQHAVSQFRPSAWEQTLMEQYGLGVDHILWRRNQVREMSKTGIPFEQEYPETLDGCFVAAGGTGFFVSPDGIDHLGWHRQNLSEPLQHRDKLSYKGGEVSFYGSNLRVWQLPQPGQPYVGWVDCAGGGLDERADYSVLVIINALTKLHAATLRVKCAPNEFAPMVAATMTWYNTGMLGGERDAHGATCLMVLQQQLHYPSLWFYVDPLKPRPERLEPWVHPTVLRNRILTEFRGAVFDHTFLTRDKQLLLEMGAFTWLKIKGREGLKAAGKGQKDDLVIGAAGASFLTDTAASAYTRRQTAGQVTVVGPNGLVIAKQGQMQETRPWLR